MIRGFQMNGLNGFHCDECLPAALNRKPLHYSMRSNKRIDNVVFVVQFLLGKIRCLFVSLLPNLQANTADC